MGLHLVYSYAGIAHFRKACPGFCLVSSSVFLAQTCGPPVCAVPGYVGLILFHHQYPKLDRCSYLTSKSQGFGSVADNFLCDISVIPVTILLTYVKKDAETEGETINACGHFVTYSFDACATIRHFTFA